MTRLSDEEIWNTLLEKVEPSRRLTLTANPFVNEVRGLFIEGHRQADSIYIPQIEKLQGEIERLKKDLTNATGGLFTEFELNYAKVKAENTSKEFKIIELEDNFQQLTAKHERFVNVAREFHDYIIMHPVKAFDVPDEIYIPFNNALTEEGNV